MENIDNATLSSAITQPAPARAARRRIVWPRGLWRRILKTMAQRRELATLDDRFWADMGIGRGDALMESRRHFWDLRHRDDPTRQRRGD